jgi:S-adenosylmethionine decarboxylase
MTKITTPLVMRYEGSKPEDWGISGFVMIAESHISIHTFPRRGLLWVDAFSCKGFDAAPIVDELRSSFRLREVQMQVLERGLEYAAPVPSGAGTATSGEL